MPAGRNAAVCARVAEEARQFVIAGTVEFAAGIVEINNEGGEGSPPAPIDTGELRSEVHMTLNSPSTVDSGPPPYSLFTPADLRRAVQLAGLSVGDVLVLTWAADHAYLIEQGRTTNKHGQPIGSEQAPDGWLWLALETRLVQMDGWRHLG